MKTFLAHLLSAVLLAQSHLGWSAQHMLIDVDLDTGTRMLSATASIRTSNESLVFFLARDFVLEAVEIDGATAPTERTSVDDLQRFNVDLRSDAAEHVVKLRYHGMLKPLNTAMAHHDTLAGLPAMASDQGSYLPGSSGWHPILEGEFTYRLSAAVPPGQIAVAPGAASAENRPERPTRAVYSMMHPVDGIDLMVGPWKTHKSFVEVGGKGIELRAYFYPQPGAEDLAESYLRSAHQFIERYSAEIGPYPYSEFSIVASPIPTGFGMPTLTYLGKDVLHFPFIRDISLGHEVLHNWWGNGVRVDPKNGNWAEGLTTFMADYAYREDHGPDAALEMRHGWLRNYATLPAGTEQPLSAFRSRHHVASAAIGYGKASMMFYALRDSLGPDVFRQAVRDFWNHHKFNAASFNDLQAAFEQASGRSLSDFFEQWLDRTGAPALQVVRARASASDNESTILDIELTQDEELFSLSVPVRTLFDTGKSDFRVEVTDRRQSFQHPVSERPTGVQIDPEFEVWRKLTPGEAPPILRDLVAADQFGLITVGLGLEESVSAFAREFAQGRTFAPDSTSTNSPMLFAGDKSACDVFLARESLSPRPASIPPGLVETWVVPDISRTIVVVCIDSEAEQLQNLSGLGRRLRHFGRYSWVSIAEDGAANRGNWTIKPPTYPVQ